MPLGAHNGIGVIPNVSTQRPEKCPMTGENGEPLEGWAMPPRPHCGEWHETADCPTCGTYLPMPDCVLGEN